jgi:hypothetical protein
MNAHEPEDLHRLLSDAVDDIEPGSGIEAIRSRISTKEDTMTPRNGNTRTWLLGALGAAAATAAVITAIVVVGNDDPETTNNGPVDQPSETVSASEEPTDDEPTEAPPVDADPVPVYWVGDTARGLGLYREFRENTEGDDPTQRISAALDHAVNGSPLDPDYRTDWPEDAEAPVVAASADLITIGLEGDLHDRPAGMSAEAAQAAIDQLIYTAQGAYGEGRIPVRFELNGGITDTVLGVPTSEPLSEGAFFETLSLVNIDTPAEGAVVSDDTLTVSGVANSFEANVIVKLQRFEGTFVAFQEGVTAEGWMEERLFPFSQTFDISDLEPGKYILSASTDDPSAGAEGFGADTDTKVITVE